MLASSAKPDEVDHYLDLLDARALVDGWTTRATSSAPSPSPTSSRRRSRRPAAAKAVMVGDSTWDCEAAKRAGVTTVGVLTGGFSERELLDAGATCVFDSLGRRCAGIWRRRRSHSSRTARSRGPPRR